MEKTLQSTDQPQEDQVSLAVFLRSRGYQAVAMQKSAVGHFEVRASINGHEALMLLDTGASMTVIDQESAPKFGLVPKASAEKGGGLGSADVDVSSCAVDNLLIEGIEMQPMQVFVMDLSHVNQALDARGTQRADGVIGADILNQTLAIIDYSDAVVYLR